MVKAIEGFGLIEANGHTWNASLSTIIVDITQEVQIVKNRSTCVAASLLLAYYGFGYSF
jgi:hypothetical protein